MIDLFQIFLIKNGSHFLIEYLVFSLYNVFKVKKKANEYLDFKDQVLNEENEQIHNYCFFL